MRLRPIARTCPVRKVQVLDRAFDHSVRERLNRYVSVQYVFNSRDVGRGERGGVLWMGGKTVIGSWRNIVSCGCRASRGTAAHARVGG